MMKLSVLTATLALGASCSNGTDLASQDQALVPVGDFLTLAGPYNNLFFPSQDLGTVSLGQQLTLLNSGTINLSVTTLSFIGLNPGDFALGPLTTCLAGTVLAPAATCVVNVTFAPTVAGTRSARIQIVDSANGTPHTIPVSGAGHTPGAPVAAVGPIDLRTGFPAYYQDTTGLKIQPCYDNALMCLSTVPNFAAPPLVADVGSNYPYESFYLNATVGNQPVGQGLKGKATLVLALEGTFLNTAGLTLPADQIVFGRIRVKMTKLDPNVNYTITHPYGSTVLTADAGGTIFDTIDIGCKSTPCDFRGALESQLLQSSFLQWDPAVLPLAPPGFLGNPGIPHPIVGSPTGNNFFRIVGPHANNNTNTITFTNFSLSGEILP
jgi:hypothetical protein